MRRVDREVKDISDILGIIDKCDSCNLGLSLNDMPYVVPLNFGYEYLGGALTLYFHGAKEGKKSEIIRANKRACFSMDRSHRLLASEEASSYSMAYESVMGFGQIENLQDLDEKRKGLAAIMKKYAPDREFEYPVKMLEATAVFKLAVQEFTGKRNKG